MRVSKNIVSSEKALVRFHFGDTMAGGRCISITLFGNSYSTVITKEAAKDLADMLEVAAKKIRKEWAPQLEYETEKQAGW